MPFKLFFLTVICFTFTRSPWVEAALTINDAIAEALKNNFEIRMERLNPEIAKDNLYAEEAEFYPFAYAQLNHNDIERFQNSIDFSSRDGIRRWEQEDWRATTGVGGKLPTGTAYEVYYTVASGENSLNRAAPSMNALFTPEVETFAGVKLTQPLLKNSGWSVNTTGMRIARIGIKVSGLEHELLITNKAQEVCNAYYDLVYAQKAVGLSRQTLETAESFKVLAEERLNVGQGTSLDVSQAEMNIYNAKERMIVAQNNYERSLVTLLKVIQGEQGSPWDAGMVLPETIPQIELERDQEHYTQLAMQKRIDLRLATYQEEQSRLRLAYAENQKMPELNLEFSYGLNGFGGTHQDSFDTLTKAGEPEWMAGFSFRVPIGKDRNAAYERIAEHRRQQARLSVGMHEKNIRLEVRNAFSRIQIYQQRLETARHFVELSQEVFAVEQERYRNGRSSSYDVLDAQDKVSESLIRELAARVDLAKSFEELWLVSGVLLQQHAILGETH